MIVESYNDRISVQAIFLPYTLVSINVCAIFTYAFVGYPCRYKLGQFRMHQGKIMGLISSENCETYDHSKCNYRS